MAQVSQAATVLEDWQMNDANGTTLSNLSNSAGSATFANDATNATANGSGDLHITPGANIFRTSNLTTTNVSSGTFQLEFNFSSVNFQSGDTTGANVSFGIRDTTTNTDLFLARVQKQNNKYLLQTRVSSTNTTVADFGTTVGTNLNDLNVRVVFNLDTDKADVFWSLAGAAESSHTDIAINNLEMDAFRFAANTNTTDLGTGETSVDFVTISAVPEPSSTALLGLGCLALILRRRK